MEYCPSRFSGLAQLFSESVQDATMSGRHVLNHSVQMSEVIRPQPYRALRVPCLIDGLNRYNCKAKRLSTHRDDGMDVLDFILNMDDLHADPESSSQTGFFCGSPPVRLDNPLVHDPEFIKQSMIVPPTLKNSCSSMHSPCTERSNPSCGSSYSGSPKVRIEGFASGNSDCHSLSAGA